MWDVSDQLNPQNSQPPGRHRLGGDFDDFDDFDDAEGYSGYAEDTEYAPGDDADSFESSEADARVAPEGLAGVDRAETRHFRRGAAAGAVRTPSGSSGAGHFDEYGGYGRDGYQEDEYADRTRYVDRPSARTAATGVTAAAPAAAGGTDDVGDGAGDGHYTRVLAIVVLVIGVCLVAYGIYALVTRGDDTSAAGSETSSSSSVSAPVDGNAGSPTATASEDGNVAPPPPSNEQGESGQPLPPPAANTEAAPEIDRKNTRVSVLNNSVVVGLADQVSGTIGQQGWGIGETGNAPENTMGRWERTTVCYDANSETDKAAAEQIAADNGWVAAPRDDRLRDAPAGIVVVATNPAA